MGPATVGVSPRLAGPALAPDTLVELDAVALLGGLAALAAAHAPDLPEEVVAVPLLRGLATLATGFDPAHLFRVRHVTHLPRNQTCPIPFVLNNLNWSGRAYGDRRDSSNLPNSAFRDLVPLSDERHRGSTLRIRPTQNSPNFASLTSSAHCRPHSATGGKRSVNRTEQGNAVRQGPTT